MATALRAPRLDIPADPRLPMAASLLDVEVAASILAATLPGTRVERVRELSYSPANALCVRYRTSDASGLPLVTVAHLTERGLRAWHWPFDPALPVLTDERGLLASALAAHGLAPQVDPAVPLSYRPLQRATLALDDAILKAYASQADFARAAAALRASATLAVPCPMALGADDGLLITLQSHLSGAALTPETALGAAPEVGRLCAAVHRAPVDGLPGLDASAIAARCVAPARLAAATVPWLAPRIARCRDRVLATVPPAATSVCSHGDLSVDQVIATPSGLALVDFDDLCAAPAAHDLATFAANLVSGRPGDLDRCHLALAAAVEGYGSRPAHLQWHLAAALLRRVDRPLRRAKRRWVERCASILNAVEEVLP